MPLTRKDVEDLAAQANSPTIYGGLAEPIGVQRKILAVLCELLLTRLPADETETTKEDATQTIPSKGDADSAAILPELAPETLPADQAAADGDAQHGAIADSSAPAESYKLSELQTGDQTLPPDQSADDPLRHEAERLHDAQGAYAAHSTFTNHDAPSEVSAELNPPPAEPETPAVHETQEGNALVYQENSPVVTNAEKTPEQIEEDSRPTDERIADGTYNDHSELLVYAHAKADSDPADLPPVGSVEDRHLSESGIEHEKTPEPMKQDTYSSEGVAEERIAEAEAEAEADADAIDETTDAEPKKKKTKKSDLSS